MGVQLEEALVMRLSSLFLSCALVGVPVAAVAQEPRSPDMQKQQHPENNPKPKTSTGSDSGSGSSQLNQGDVPKDMPSGGEGATSTSKSTTHKRRTKKQNTSTSD